MTGKEKEGKSLVLREPESRLVHLPLVISRALSVELALCCAVFEIKGTGQAGMLQVLIFLQYLNATLFPSSQTKVTSIIQLIMLDLHKLALVEKLMSCILLCRRKQFGF